MKQIKNIVTVHFTKKLNDLTNRQMYILVSIISVIVYVDLYGFSTLNPQNINWILQEHNDFENGYLAWKAFRNSPWMFPLGFMNVLSYPEYTSVMFSGAIPGMALFFKLLRFVLPTTFQYFGIWSILCMILMGIYSSKVLYRLSDDRWLSVVGSLFFILAPIMHKRMFAHTGLDGQWLLIAAFDMCLDMRNKKWEKCIWIKGGVFGAIAILQHTYFLPIVAVILLYGVIYNILKRNHTLKSIALIIIYTVSGFAVVYFLGGFSTNISSGTAGGLGQYSMNLNALINSRCDPEIWSIFIKPLSYHHNGQQEGFAYLGIGILFVLVIDVFFFFFYTKNKNEIIKKSRVEFIAIGVVMTVALVLSLSPIATVGKKMIYEIELPDNIEKVWSIFRSSGRFSWILVYAMMMIAIVCLYKIKRSWSIYFLAVAVMIQVIDLSEIFSIRKDMFTRQYEYMPYTYTDPSWRILGELGDIKYVYFVPNNYAFTMEDNFIIIDWALDKGISVNSFYFSHQDSKELISNNSICALDDPEKGSLFLFSDKETMHNYAADNLYYYNIGEFIIGYALEIEELKMNRYQSN